MDRGVAVARRAVVAADSEQTIENECPSAAVAAAQAANSTVQLQQQQQQQQVGSQLAAQNKRKEKARIAARARRSQEANIIMEMANELHITQEKIRRIDKATIVKLAIDYIKAFEILCRFRKSGADPASFNDLSNLNNITNNLNNTTSNNNSNSNGNKIISNSCCNHQNQNIIDNINIISRPQATTKIQLINAQPPIPKLSTDSIFAPKTDDMDSYFLMINDKDGKPAFVLKPDSEILDEDDLTHLAPQAGDSSISLEVEPLDGIILDTSLFNSGSPPMKRAPLDLQQPQQHHHHQHHHPLMNNSNNNNKGLLGFIDEEPPAAQH